MSSAAKLEPVALFIAAKEMVFLLQTIIRMGCHQPSLDLQTVVLTNTGVTNNTIVPKRTKARDMQTGSIQHCT